MTNRQPIAVFVIGPPGAGKSTITKASLVDKLGFTLIDVDVPFEKLLDQYNLSPNIVPDTPEHKAARKKKNEAINYLISIGHLPPKRKMCDYLNPYEYLEGQEITTNRVTVVAREINKRNYETAQFFLEDMVIVETGGQAGRIKNDKKRLEAKGYKTHIIYVCPYAIKEINDQVYQDIISVIVDRNNERAANGGRELDVGILETSLSKLLAIKDDLLNTFDSYSEIDSTNTNMKYTTDFIVNVINEIRDQ